MEDLKKRVKALEDQNKAMAELIVKNDTSISLQRAKDAISAFVRDALMKAMDKEVKDYQSNLEKLKAVADDEGEDSDEVEDEEAAPRSKKKAGTGHTSGASTPREKSGDKEVAMKEPAEKVILKYRLFEKIKKHLKNKARDDGAPEKGAEAATELYRLPTEHLLDYGYKQSSHKDSAGKDYAIYIFGFTRTNEGVQARSLFLFDAQVLMKEKDELNVKRNNPGIEGGQLRRLIWTYTGKPARGRSKKQAKKRAVGAG